MPPDFPEKLLDRLKRIYDELTYESLLQTFQTKRETTLRVNLIKISVNNFIEQAKIQGANLESVLWSDSAFILRSPTLREFSETSLYKSGHCYVQSFSSMLPPLILNPLPNETILDIAAAPGSKTTQIAMMMKNNGSIIANDSSHIRLYKLQANLEKLGVTNVTVRKGVGQTIWQEYPEFFDRTLVDVPCSMEGRIESTDPKTYSFWSTKKIKELVEIQRYLLKAAVSATKVGGTIVYSTCTLSPEENEGVVDWILRKEGDKVQIEDFSLPNVPFSSPIQSWNEKQFDTHISKTKRILTSSTFEGFYIAKLKKIAPSFSSSTQFPTQLK